MAPDGDHADSTVGGDEHPRRFNIVRAIVFDLDVVATDSAARKPDRAAFEKGCRALRVASEETAHVGDSLSNDVEGALQAGLMSIWLDRYADSAPIPTGAYHITSLAEIPELLLSAA